MAELISVELSNGSIFKFTLTANTTPLEIIKLTAQKARIAHIEYFGLIHARTSNESYANITNSNRSNDVERAFLQNDLPLIVQGAKKDARLLLSVKYGFLDAKIDLSDEKTILLMFLEIKSRYLRQTHLRISRDTALQLAAFLLQSHCATQSSEEKITPDSLWQYVPKSLSDIIGLEENFCKETHSLMRPLKGLSFKNSARKFLGYIKQTVPSLFTVYFEAIHTDPFQSVWIGVATEGIRFFNSELEPQLFLPYKCCLSWNVTSISDDEVLHVDGTSPSNDSNDSIPLAAGSLGHRTGVSASFSSLNVLQSPSTTGWKNKLTVKSRNQRSKEVTSQPKLSTADYLGSTGEKQYRSILTLRTTNQRLKPIELVLMSHVMNNERIIEMLDYYSSKNSIEKELEVEEVDDIIDDPTMSEEPVTCVAKFDYVAKSDEELMFLQNELITVKEKLGNGFYVGECQGVKGVFKGTHVTFKAKPKDNNATQVKVSLRRRSTIEGQLAVGGQSGGDVLVINLLDQTRLTVLVSSKTTGKGLRDQILDKMELTDADFFEVADMTEYTDRWLHPQVPVLQQGISQSSKLVFKARSFIRDIEDILDAKAVHLYFVQAKQIILSNQIAVTDNDAIELAALYLQATLGDNDPDKHKAGYIESLSNYLPQSVIKISMTRSEAWYQKKIFSSHQQLRGMPRSDAEKAYVTRCQSNPLFNYSLYPNQSNENILLGINREGVAIVDKSSKTIIEKFGLGNGLKSWSNGSFVVELNDTQEKTYRYFSYQCLKVIENIWYIVDGHTRISLQRKCKDLRNNFKLLNVPLTLPQNMRDQRGTSTDPENLSLCLRDGSSLCRLANLLKSETTDEIDYTSNDFNDVPTYLCIENISRFLNVVRDDLGFPEKDLFVAEELYNFDLAGFGAVVQLLQSIFQHERGKSKLSEAIAIQNKLNSQRRSSNNRQMRELVVNEIATTERNYVQYLNETIRKYYAVIYSKQLLGPEDVVKVFGNIEEMYEFQQAFLNSIEKAIGASKSPDDTIARAFIQHSSGFEKVYQVYCAAQSDGAERLLQLKDVPPLSREFQKDGDAPWVTQLSSLLIKPVQRILKYHLLLKELLRNTNADSEEKVELEEALELMKGVAQNINEIKRVKENQKALLELQNRIEGYEGPSLTDLGELLQDGNILMVEMTQNSRKTNTSKDSTFHFFLFQDVLISCKEYTKKPKVIGYKFKTLIPVNMIIVKDHVSLAAGDPEEMKDAWELTRMDLQKSYVMINRGYEDKERWLTILTETIKTSNIAPKMNDKDEHDRIAADRKNRQRLASTGQQENESKEEPGRLYKIGSSVRLREQNALRANTQSRSEPDVSQGATGGMDYAPEKLSRSQTALNSDLLRANIEDERQNQVQLETQLDEESKLNAQIMQELIEATDEANKLHDQHKNDRMQSRKLEMDIIREKQAAKALDEKMAIEVARREELVKLMQQTLTTLREHRTKLAVYIEKDKKQRDRFVGQINGLSHLYGMGNVVAPSLASILTPQDLLAARKNVLAGKE